MSTRRIPRPKAPLAKITNISLLESVPMVFAVGAVIIYGTTLAMAKYQDIKNTRRPE